MLPDLPKLGDVLKIHGLRARKSLGQNFLLDPSVLSQIVKAAGSLESRTIIEIGPGPGGLTRQILEQGAQELFVIEMDPRCVEIMHELQAYYPDTLQIIEGDALNVSCENLGSTPRKIIANLPYNVSVPLLFQWLEHISDFESLTLMFQKEVAKRITAKPRTSDYGKLSVMAQWCCETQLLFDIPPGAFTPPPKVTSTVVHLRPKHLMPTVNPQALQKVTQAGFNQRRKMLRASLKSISPDPLTLLEKASLDPTKRAEELSVEEFCLLAQIFESLH